MEVGVILSESFLHTMLAITFQFLLLWSMMGLNVGILAHRKPVVRELVRMGWGDRESKICVCVCVM